jgi:hypothetical protein
MKKYFWVVLVLLSFNLFSMQLYEDTPHLFLSEPVPTEYQAYQLLKSSPLLVQTTYIAIPWTVLINRRQLYGIPPVRVSSGFTICQHISYEIILPLLDKMGVTVLFTPHASKQKTFKNIKIIPFPHFQKNGIDPAVIKDIYYSFVGCTRLEMLGKKGHDVRAPLLVMSHPDTCIVKDRSHWHFWCDEQQQKEYSREYKEILARSRFALCPRGSGPSTIRFWEALQAGAIPVLISDDMSLPAEVNWDEAIVRIKEKDMHLFQQVLVSITKEQEEQMRKKCLEIHKRFSGDNFVSTIRHYYGEE